MLNYVHEGAVYEQLRSIVAMAGKQEERKADETLRRLADRRLLHLLVSRLTIAGTVLTIGFHKCLHQERGSFLFRNLTNHLPPLI